MPKPKPSRKPRPKPKPKPIVHTDSRFRTERLFPTLSELWTRPNGAILLDVTISRACFSVTLASGQISFLSEQLRTHAPATKSTFIRSSRRAIRRRGGMLRPSGAQRVAN